MESRIVFQYFSSVDVSLEHTRGNVMGRWGAGLLSVLREDLGRTSALAVGCRKQVYAEEGSSGAVFSNAGTLSFSPLSLRGTACFKSCSHCLISSGCPVHFGVTWKQVFLNIDPALAPGPDHLEVKPCSSYSSQPLCSPLAFCCVSPPSVSSFTHEPARVP